MIQSVHMNSCLAAQIGFLMFKGPGPFKTIFKIGIHVDEFKASRLIPLTPPPPFSFFTTFKLTFKDKNLCPRLNLPENGLTIISPIKLGDQEKRHM
jgi:hypothetical protein